MSTFSFNNLPSLPVLASFLPSPAFLPSPVVDGTHRFLAQLERDRGKRKSNKRGSGWNNPTRNPKVNTLSAPKQGTTQQWRERKREKLYPKKGTHVHKVKGQCQYATYLERGKEKGPLTTWKTVRIRLCVCSGRFGFKHDCFERLRLKGKHFSLCSQRVREREEK